MNSPEVPLKPEVKAVIDTYPEQYRPKILHLRTLIFETAAILGNVGELEETLKWGEPSYLTPETKCGSTIRIAWKEKLPDQYLMFFKCTANLVPAFKEKFSRQFSFGGERSVDFQLVDTVPEDELRHCIAMALTYHRNKHLDSEDRWKSVELQ